MNWLIPALLAPAIYSANIFVDKYIVSKEIKDYRVVPIFTGLAGAVIGTAIWSQSGQPVLPPRVMVITLASGAMITLATFIYFKVLISEEASKVNLLLQAIPVFILLLGYIFLHEPLSVSQLAGFLLILIPVAIICAGSDSGKFKLTSALYWILLADLVWAASAVLTKFAIESSSFLKTISYQNWGLGLGGLLIYALSPTIRSGFNKIFLAKRRKGPILIFGNEVLYISTKVLTFFAFSLAPAALVSVLEGTQVFYGMLLGWILTILIPKVFKENISTKDLIKKVFWAAVVLVGIVLISY